MRNVKPRKYSPPCQEGAGGGSTAFGKKTLCVGNVLPLTLPSPLEGRGAKESNDRPPWAEESQDSKFLREFGF